MDFFASTHLISSVMNASFRWLTKQGSATSPVRNRRIACRTSIHAGSRALSRARGVVGECPTGPKTTGNEPENIFAFPVNKITRAIRHFFRVSSDQIFTFSTSALRPEILFVESAFLARQNTPRRACQIPHKPKWETTYGFYGSGGKRGLFPAEKQPVRNDQKQRRTVRFTPLFRSLLRRSRAPLCHYQRPRGTRELWRDMGRRSPSLPHKIARSPPYDSHHFRHMSR